MRCVDEETGRAFTREHDVRSRVSMAFGDKRTWQVESTGAVDDDGRLRELWKARELWMMKARWKARELWKTRRGAEVRCGSGGGAHNDMASEVVVVEA